MGPGLRIAALRTTSSAGNGRCGDVSARILVASAGVFGGTCPIGQWKDVMGYPYGKMETSAGYLSFYFAGPSTVDGFSDKW